MPGRHDERNDEQPSVLLVDDSEDLRSLVRAMLERHFGVIEAADATDALRSAEQNEPDAVLLDLNLGSGPDGFSALDRLRELDPELPVVVLSAYRDPESIVRAMKAGAVHFIAKPPDHEELLQRMRVVIAERRRSLGTRVNRLPPLPHLVGESAAMRRLRDLAHRAAESDLPVLILGETGTGKGLLARCIHHWGRRRSGPYREVNVAGLPSTVLDSELFGHERGSFTGAERRHRGLFELASGGTILLDEIGDLPRECQIKLLQVVEDGCFHRMGSEQVHHADTRVVAATHRRLASLVAEGKFRADLYHRLRGLEIVIPPLRERLEDLAALVRDFVGPGIEVTQAALELLSRQSWPGNVRQLQQALRRASLFADAGTIEPRHLDDLPTAGNLPDGPTGLLHTAWLGLSYREAKENVDRRFQHLYLESLLRATRGNVAEAARRSGLSRTHLHALVRELGLGSRPDVEET